VAQTTPLIRRSCAPVLAGIDGHVAEVVPHTPSHKGQKLPKWICAYVCVGKKVSRKETHTYVCMYMFTIGRESRKNDVANRTQMGRRSRTIG